MKWNKCILCTWASKFLRVWAERSFYYALEAEKIHADLLRIQKHKDERFDLHPYTSVQSVVILFWMKLQINVQCVERRKKNTKNFNK